MNIKEAVIAALKEMVLPELAALKQEQEAIRNNQVIGNQRLDELNRRLDDLNAHLIDQSRRIDALREELTSRIDALRTELTIKIDAVREELTSRINALREELTDKGEASRAELSGQIAETNKRLDRLYEVIVRRDEHQQLNERVQRLEQDMQELKRHVAA